MTATARANTRAEAADAQPRPARRRRRLGDRITVGHVLPVILAVIAAVSVAVALGDRTSTSQVPVANGPIAAGAPVNAAVTHLVTVHAGDTALRAGLLAPSDLGGGWVAASAIGAGDPITRSMVVRVVPGAGGLGSMSIPVSISHADGGAIVVGDHVDVIAQSGTSGSQYVAQDLRVLNVPPSTRTGVLATSNNDYYVVVAVDRATALKLSSALAASSGAGSSGGLQVVRTTGETVGGG